MKNDKNIDKDWKRFVEEGDERSFENMFRSFYKQMYGYGIKLCNQPSVVKDCIHDLFEKMWIRRDELDHIYSPNVYLFVSLRRKLLKRIKQSSNKCDLDEIDESGFIEFSRQELLIRDEIKIKKKGELQRALNQLTDRQKEIIFLRFYNGLSYGEIEKILSINRQSLRNHVHRGMKTLRSLLDNEIMKLVVSFFFCMLHLI